MTGELTIFKTGGHQPSTAFQGVHLPTSRLDDGVSAGFAKVSYKGSKWGIKYQGQYHPAQARMPDGTIIQSPFLDVVILRAAGHPSKAWYEGLYAEGDSAPPDCWSTNGFKPDVGVPKMQCQTCVGCQWNVWGSKVNRDTGEATRGKACMDSKRLAVVPVGDIENMFYGGPMMLNVPPTSLKRLGPYQNGLEANGFHYAQVWTRLTFEPQSAYPLFNFDAMAALNDAQAQQVVKMMNHPLIERILNTELRMAEAWDEPAPNPSQVQVATPAQPQPASHAPQQAAHAPPPAQTEADRQFGQPHHGHPPATAGQAQDDLTIPEHLRRPQPSAPPQQAVQPVQPPPPSGPAPGTAPVQQEVLPPAQQPQVQLPPGMVLPPGMTPEMAAAFMAQMQPKARGRAAATKRTPPVQPTNMDSSQPQQGQPAQPGPVMMTVPATAPQANGSGQPAQPDQAVQSIMSTVKGLL
jgi:hypothetical protein